MARRFGLDPIVELARLVSRTRETADRVGLQAVLHGERELATLLHVAAACGREVDPSEHLEECLQVHRRPGRNHPDLLVHARLSLAAS